MDNFIVTKEILMEAFPGLLNVVESTSPNPGTQNQYTFVDSFLVNELIVLFNNSTFSQRKDIYFGKHTKVVIEPLDHKRTFSLTLRIYNSDLEKSKGYFVVNNSIQLSDQFCAILYNHNIDVYCDEIYHSGYLRPYDKQRIMRAYTINNILQNE